MNNVEAAQVRQDFEMRMGAAQKEVDAIAHNISTLEAQLHDVITRDPDECPARPLPIEGGSTQLGLRIDDLIGTLMIVNDRLEDLKSRILL